MFVVYVSPTSPAPAVKLGQTSFGPSLYFHSVCSKSVDRHTHTHGVAQHGSESARQYLRDLLPDCC